MSDKKDDENQKEQADAATAIVAQARTEASTAKSEDKKQDNQKNQHIGLQLRRVIKPRNATAALSVVPTCDQMRAERLASLL